MQYLLARPQKWLVVVTVVAILCAAGFTHNKYEEMRYRHDLEGVKMPTGVNCSSTSLVQEELWYPCVNLTIAQCRVGNRMVRVHKSRDNEYVEVRTGVRYDHDDCTDVGVITMPDSPCLSNNRKSFFRKHHVSCSDVLSEKTVYAGSERNLVLTKPGFFCENQMPAGCCHGVVDIGLDVKMSGYVPDPEDYEAPHVHMKGKMENYDIPIFYGLRDDCSDTCVNDENRFGRIFILAARKHWWSQWSWMHGSMLTNVKYCLRSGRVTDAVIDGVGELQGTLTVKNAIFCNQPECGDHVGCCYNSGGNWAVYTGASTCTTSVQLVNEQLNYRDIVYDCGKNGWFGRTTDWFHWRVEGAIVTEGMDDSGKECTAPAPICTRDDRCERNSGLAQQQYEYFAGKNKAHNVDCLA